MKKEQINIRDPFILVEDGKYYMYGTRAAGFGMNPGGFDVYVSDDLDEWSEPHECFNSAKYDMNSGANWAPEVHKYNEKYYMFATFNQKNGLRGTFSMRADSPMGPFLPHSNGAVTPEEWECLDGTLYIDEDNIPYLIFCHEHTQIIDGTMCYARLNEDLSALSEEPTTMFNASSFKLACPMQGKHEGHYVTDGPFMYRSKTDQLFMIWSTFINGKYAECVVKFNNGKLGMDFEHLRPLLDSDGGHGMIFSDGRDQYFVFHTPNKSTLERPAFRLVIDNGDSISIE